MQRFFALPFGVILLLIPLPHGVEIASAQRSPFSSAAIFYNEACADCATYLQETLVPLLRQLGIQNIVRKDYVNERAYRTELYQLNSRIGIPFELQSHLVTVLDGGTLILEGHVPEHLILSGASAVADLPENLVMYQDTMPGHGSDITGYALWSPRKPIRWYDLAEPLATHLQWYQSAEGEVSGEQPSRALLPLVLATGLLDGINPCAFAVLIFFIAFLFTLRSTVRRIFAYGILYIVVIYLTYLGIGLGLFKAVVFSNEPHLMAKVGAWFVIVLGLVNIMNVFVKQFPIKLRIPRFSQGTLTYWLKQATVPSVIVAAFLVGLCTFPCSGGMYVAIIGLLAAQQTFWQGFGYLLIYNVMFVVPLIVLLALAGNRYTLGTLAEWQVHHDRSMKLILGLVMIGLGVVILLFFI